MLYSPLKIAIVCWLLFAMAGAGNAAGILNGIPGGAFTEASGLFSNPIGGTGYSGEGSWHTHSSTNASVSLVGSGVDRHVELFSDWFVRSCSLWYTDVGTTPAGAAWRISTVLTWTGGSGTTNSFRLHSGTDVNDSPEFQLTFCGTEIRWVAGAQSGSFTSLTGLDLTRRTLSISYDPVSGQASASLDDEQIFSLHTDMELSVRSVLVKQYQFEYNPGTLSVYNISSSSLVPQQVIDTFVYASDTAAQAAWVEGNAGDPVERTIEDEVPCLALYNAYTPTSLRGSWDQFMSVDLSGQDAISLSLKTTRVNSFSPIRISIGVYDGDGVAYDKFFYLYGEEWGTYTFDFSDFSPALTSGQLKNITRIRLSCWQGTDSTPATVYVSGLKAGRSSANWLHNCSFETTTSEDLPDYWGPTINRWGASSQWVLDLDTWRTRWGVDRAVAHSGSNSLRIVRSDAADQDMMAVSTERKLSTQTTYTLSAWIRSDQANLPVVFGIGARTKSTWDGDSRIFTTPAAPNTWERCYFTFTTPVSGDDYLYDATCRIYSPEIGTLWIDEVQVEKGVTATIWQPMISDPYITASGVHRDIAEVSDKNIIPGGSNLPAVMIDTHRRFLVNNEPFIPRAIMWDGPPSTNITEHLAKSGFNTLVLMLRASSVMQDVKNFLDDANKNGLRVIVNFWNDMGTALQATWIHALKDDYPAVIMWYVADEPYGEDDWAAASNKYHSAKSLDDRPVMVNLSRDYDVDWSSDVLCMDYYPIGSGVTINVGLKKLGDNVATLHQTAVSAGKPAWNFQQNTGYAYFCYRELTDAEQECQVYQSLIHGSRSILYFYQKPRLRDHWRKIRTLNDEIRQLTPVFYSTETAPAVSVTASNNIHFISKRYDGVNYVIAVSDSSRPITTTLTMPDTSNALVLFEDRMIYPSNGVFTDTFAAYQRHVYRCGNEIVSLNVDGADVKVYWDGSESAKYTLQSKRDLTALFWSNVQTNISGIDGPMSVNTGITSEKSFYRITSP